MDGVLHPFVKVTVEYLDSFAETSPSGDGIHVIVRANLNGHRNRTGHTPWGGSFEAYSKDRYFTITGKMLAEAPATVENRQQELEDMIGNLIPVQVPGPGPASRVVAPVDVDDAQLLEKARRARDGDRFSALYDRGDFKGEGFVSQSEADLSLCGSLGFWAGGDPARIDWLFRSSALMRDKWDKHRSFATDTIAKALAGRTEFYRPSRSPEPPRPETEQRSSPPRPDRDRRVVVTPSALIVPEAVEYAWEGRWPLKSLSLVVGVWGVNKSMLTLEKAARISRGQLPGDLYGKPRSVIVASAEDAPSHTQVPRLIAAGADRERVFFISIAVDDFESDISLPEDTERLEEAIVQHEAGLVLVDPLTAHLGAEVNSYKDQDVRRVLGPLARVADRTGCAIVAVVHLNKVPSTDLFMKIAGSVGIGAAARSVLLVARDPEAEEEQGPERVAVHGKSNVGPFAPTLRFKVEGRLITNPQGDEIETAGIVWTGEAEGMGASTVLGGGQKEREAAPKRNAAEGLLQDLLADGPRLRTDIEDAAKDAGVSWRTVVRTKADLGIISEQHQESGKIGRGPSYWSFPDGIGVPTPSTHKMAHQIKVGQDTDLGFGVPGVPGIANEVAYQGQDDQQTTPSPFAPGEHQCSICRSVGFFAHPDGGWRCRKHEKETA